MSTTIAGNLKTLLGVAVISNCFVRFNLRGCNGSQARVSGTALIPPAKGTSWYVDIVPDASGVLAGVTYSNDVDIDTTLTPGQHPTWYGVVIYQSGIPGPETPYLLADGTTFNLNSAVAMTTQPVVTPPTGDTTYARLDGGNMPFTGQVVGKNGSVSSPGFAFASSLTTGFWRQAADVIGVSIAGVLKWLVNSVGLLFGSGQAIGYSSNADPSLAAGDSWLSRLGAGIIGIGTAAGNALGTLRAAILQIGGSDTGITRDSAGVIDVGNGAQGDVSGGIKAASLALGGGTALTTTNRTGTGNLVLATAPSITNETVDIINQPAATAFVIKDNQGGTRYSIPSGGVTQATINNSNLTGASNSNSVTLLNEQGPAAEINGTGSAVTVFTYTLPANVMQAGKGIRIKYWANHSTGGGVQTHQVTFGGTAYFSNTDSGATGQVAVEVNIFNNAGVTNAQHGSTMGQNFPGATITTTSFTGLTSAIATTSNVTIAATFNSAAGTKLTPGQWIVELIQ